MALAATSWYEKRHEHQREIEALLEIRAALEADFQNLSEIESFTRRRVEHIQTLLSHLESDAPYSVDSPVSFSWLAGWRSVRIRSAPYESLKEDGLSLIALASRQIQIAWHAVREDCCGQSFRRHILERVLRIGIGS